MDEERTLTNLSDRYEAVWFIIKSILPGEATLLFSFCHPFRLGLLLKERICS